MNRSQKVSRQTQTAKNIQCLKDNAENLDGLQKADSITNQAILYAGRGGYLKSEPLFKQAVELIESLLGTENPSVASSYNNLGVLYYFLGRYAEAKHLCVQALELRVSLLGEQHSDVAQSKSNLAALYRNLGQYAVSSKIHPLLRTELRSDIKKNIDKLAALYSFQQRYAKIM